MQAFVNSAYVALRLLVSVPSSYIASAKGLRSGLNGVDDVLNDHCRLLIVERGGGGAFRALASGRDITRSNTLRQIVRSDFPGDWSSLDDSALTVSPPSWVAGGV